MDVRLDSRERRVAKVFGCFAHQVRQGLGCWEGAGPYVVFADDALLQIRPGPDAPVLSLRPRQVTGPGGMECFIHCHESNAAPAAAPETLVAVYRYGLNGKVSRHPSTDGRSLGYLSDGHVAIEIARALLDEAFQRARRRPPERARLARAAPGEGRP